MCDHEECGELTMNHAQATNNTTSSIISVPSNHELVPPVTAPPTSPTQPPLSSTSQCFVSMVVLTT